MTRKETNKPWDDAVAEMVGPQLRCTGIFVDFTDRMCWYFGPSLPTLPADVSEGLLAACFIRTDGLFWWRNTLRQDDARLNARIELLTMSMQQAVQRGDLDGFVEMLHQRMSGERGQEWVQDN